MLKFKHYSGIGLLELMLSLAIIAILLIMATRYYESASSNQKISEAMDMFNAIRGAETNYMHSNNNAVASGSTALATLVGAGYLPASYLDSNTYTSAATSLNSNPWNLGIVVTAATGQLTVQMDTPSSDVCSQLQNRLESTVSTGTGESVSTCVAGVTSGSTGVTATYNLS